MNTPIVDFVAAYAEKNALRLHMPGHKGSGETERTDITEITGADSLYEASGIIAESEKNASLLFGADTFYSTEGSSHCIRAMLYLALLHAKRKGEEPLVWAGRNAHKTFLSAAALLDFDVEWLTAEEGGYLSCFISAKELENAFQTSKRTPAAVYITSPDYLGNVADIGAISSVCKRYGALLLVDSAHGAYLKFASSLFPIDLGADMVASSAHKTLPVLTGGAYLQISLRLDPFLKERAKTALSLFGSTSPSYLTLISLDKANAYAAQNKEGIIAFSKLADETKKTLRSFGYVLCGNEPWKITLQSKKYGYTGVELQRILEEKNIVCEFADPDYLVMMLTPQIGKEGLFLLKKALQDIPKKQEIIEMPPTFRLPKRAMRIREATLSFSEEKPIEECVGKILAAATVACPPAVPIAVCGEIIDENIVRAMRYYGIEKCLVVKE